MLQAIRRSQMTLNTKGFTALVASLALVTGLAVAPADACRRKHWRGADAGAIHGYKHWKHHRAELK
jgi:hypothetical protein